jgi:hypothetical protein
MQHPPLTPMFLVATTTHLLSPIAAMSSAAEQPLPDTPLPCAPRGNHYSPLCCPQLRPCLQLPSSPCQTYQPGPQAHGRVRYGTVPPRPPCLWKGSRSAVRGSAPWSRGQHPLGQEDSGDRRGVEIGVEICVEIGEVRGEPGTASLWTKQVAGIEVSGKRGVREGIPGDKGPGRRDRGMRNGTAPPRPPCPVRGSQSAECGSVPGSRGQHPWGQEDSGDRRGLGKRVHG